MVGPIANLKNLLLIVDGAAALAQFGLSSGDETVWWIVFAVIASIGVGAPVIIYFAMCDRAAAILGELKTWMVRNNAAVMTVPCLIIPSLPGAHNGSRKSAVNGGAGSISSVREPWGRRNALFGPLRSQTATVVGPTFDGRNLHMLFHIKQSHAPKDCPYGKGGSTSLFDGDSKDVKIRGYWLAFPQHTTYLVVETDDIVHLQRFLQPGAAVTTCEITPVSDRPVPTRAD